MIDDGPNGRRLASAYAALFSAQLAIGAAAIFARFALVAAGPLAVSAFALGDCRGAGRHCRAHACSLGGARPAHRMVVSGGWGRARGALRHLDRFARLYVGRDRDVTRVHDAVVDGPLRNARAGPPPLAALLARAGACSRGLGADRRRTRRRRRGNGPGDGRIRRRLLAWLGSIAIGVYFVIVRRVGTATSAYSTVSIVSRTYTWAALFLPRRSLAAHSCQPPPAATRRMGRHPRDGAGVAAVRPHRARLAPAFGQREHGRDRHAARTDLRRTLARVIFGESISGAAVAGAIAVLIAIALVLREERT